MDTNGLSLSFTPHTDPVTPERLIAAEKMLALLDNLEVGDPPADLVARTMARIEGSVDVRAPRPFRPSAGDSSTHA